MLDMEHEFVLLDLHLSSSPQPPPPLCAVGVSRNAVITLRIPLCSFFIIIVDNYV
jgi:hypothetical protein